MKKSLAFLANALSYTLFYWCVISAFTFLTGCALLGILWLLTAGATAHTSGGPSAIPWEYWPAAAVAILAISARFGFASAMEWRRTDSPFRHHYHHLTRP